MFGSPLFIRLLLFLQLSILGSVHFCHLIVPLFHLMDSALFSLKPACDVIYFLRELFQYGQQGLYFFKVKLGQAFSLDLSVRKLDLPYFLLSLLTLFTGLGLSNHRIAVYMLYLVTLSLKLILWLFVEHLFIHGFEVVVEFCKELFLVFEHIILL